MAQPDEAKLNQFVGRMRGDMGAAMTASLVIVGDKLGLYRAMAGGEPMTSAELARRTTVVMARAFPNSRFFGFDYHGPSIERARERAEAAGIADRVTFEPAVAKEFPGRGYDLVTFFDCLHDMGDPVGAARHVRSTLDDEGTWMIGLGAQAGEARLREVIAAGGFGRFRRAAATPFNLVLEARP